MDTIDHIEKVIKDALYVCTSLKSPKPPDVNFRVSKSVGFYGLSFWSEQTNFGHYDICTYDDIAVAGDQRLYDIVSDMYKALEKHVNKYYKKVKEKENNKMENRITSTAKTEAEVNYDNTISEIDQHQAADYDKIRKEADAARLAAKQELEIQTLREEKRRIALDYRFFYEELIAAGFTEEEAFTILLNKQPGYMAPTCYAFSDI